jgi:hypothetical protein
MMDYYTALKMYYLDNVGTWKRFTVRLVSGRAECKAS